MRIGLSTTTLEPSRNHGQLDGIGVYTNHLMEGLSSAGHQVEGRSFPKGFSAKLNYPTFSGEGMMGSFAALSGAALLSAGRIRLNPPVDLFHVTDYRIVPMKCPLVASLHDAIPLRHPDMANAKLRGLKNFVQRSIAQYADHVITLSSYTIQDLVEYYRIPEARISVVPCGVESAWFEPVPAPALEAGLKKRGVQPGYFLFVGTLQPRKNVARILAAYDCLPKAVKDLRQLVIIGKEGWSCDSIRSALQQAGGSGRVKWFNDVNLESELRLLYAGAGCFVFPSLYEGFGIPILEAFASGLPVVTSNTTSLPEVSAGVAVEVNPESVDDISAAMAWLMTDEAECNRRIAAGRERARQMTWDAMVDKTIDVYKKLI